MSRIGLVVCAGAALLLGGCTGGNRSSINALKNKPAPDFELTDLGGAAVKLSSFKGRPVMLAFFGHG